MIEVLGFAGLAITACFARCAWRQHWGRFLACAAVGMAAGLLIAAQFGEFHAAAANGSHGAAYVFGFMLAGVLVAACRYL
jgi:hypothetical protein